MNYGNLSPLRLLCVCVRVFVWMWHTSARLKIIILRMERSESRVPLFCSNAIGRMILHLAYCTITTISHNGHILCQWHVDSFSGANHGERRAVEFWQSRMSVEHIVCIGHLWRVLYSSLSPFEAPVPSSSGDGNSEDRDEDDAWAHVLPHTF